MNDRTDDDLSERDDPAAALYRQWHARRETTRDVPGVRRRVVDALLSEPADEALDATARVSPEVLYRRYREERTSTPASTIEAILAAVEAERTSQAADAAVVTRVDETAAQADTAAHDAKRTEGPSALARVFGLPGRLLDSAASVLGDALSPARRGRLLPALALAAVTFTVVPLVLVDRGSVSRSGESVASLPPSLLDEASTLATAIDTSEAIGIGFGGDDRAALAFSVGTTVTDLVVLANAERSTAIERSLVRVRTRLQRLTDTLGDARVTVAATEFAEASSMPPDAALRPALRRASDALLDALSDDPETALRYEIGGALAFLDLAASLELGALRTTALDAAFAGLARLDVSDARASLGPEAAIELEALRALSDESDAVTSDDVLRRVTRLQLLLG